MPKLARGAHEFHLGYCTNVHPGEDLVQVYHALRHYVAPLRAALFPDAEMGVGLRLSGKVANKLWFQRTERANLRTYLQQTRLVPFTVNGYPIGNFHAGRVKEEAYRPTWLEEARVNYTSQTADVLADLMGPLAKATISTLAGSFKPWGDDDEVHAALGRNLTRVAVHLHKLHAKTGKEIMVCVEPEPFTTLETVEETVRFFHDRIYGEGKKQMGQHLGLAEPEAEASLKRHLGVCFDTCHQAVEFEDLPASLRALQAAGIPIGKAQLSCALDVPRTPGTRERIEDLRAFAEDRWFHQVVGRGPGDGRLRSVDLTELLADPGREWLDSPRWRTHFHVPIHLAALGPLPTTQADLAQALEHIAATGQCPHLEIETYTWDVLPAAHRASAAEGDLLECLKREMQWAAARVRG